MSDQSEFAAAPEIFMERNIVKCQFLDFSRVPKESEVIRITIVEQTSKKCSKSGGKVFHLSSNVAGRAQNEILEIYWLAYKQNDFTQGTLDNSARYMFTALMNGCTLGFGSQTGDGTCLVSHANKASAASTGGRVGQRDAQSEQLRQRFGDVGFSMIQPDSYQLTSHGGTQFVATNFGKNVNGTWKFYTHRYMDSGGTGGVILHGGVKPAVTIAG